jgi:hypothetical protein
MSTSTPASDSARYQALRQFTGDLSNTAGSRTAAAPARFAGDPPAQVQTGDYLVDVVNQTGNAVLNHVVMRFILTGSPEIQEIPAIDVNLEQGEGLTFTLGGSCSALERYVVGSFIGPANNATVYHWIPEKGEMTPDRSSQDNPNDPGPCRDQWSFTFRRG